MSERFTDRARKVMALANQEAQRLGHDHIGSGHILLGLVKEGLGTAASVLQRFGVDMQTARLKVEEAIRPGGLKGVTGKLPLTSKAKGVIEGALEESCALSHSYIGTEHLLLGLLRDRDGIPVKVLSNLGLRIEDVRQEVLNVLGKLIENTPSSVAPCDRVLQPLSERACRVLTLASKQAWQGGEEEVGTEHILLAIIDDRSDRPMKVLSEFGVNLEALHDKLKALLPSNPCTGPEPQGDFPRSPAAQRVAGYAADEARSFGQVNVDTGHLMLGLLREHDCAAAVVLKSFGIGLDELRAKLLE